MYKNCRTHSFFFFMGGSFSCQMMPVLFCSCLVCWKLVLVPFLHFHRDRCMHYAKLEF